MSPRFLRLLTLSLALSASFGGWAQGGDWLSPGPAVPDVTLLDQDGRDVALASLIDMRPVVVNFFFTGCFATCPMQTAQLAELQSEMSARPPMGPPPLILSISLSPMSDTPAAMTDYARKFDIQLGDRANWLMLTGGYDDLRRVWQAFGQDISAAEDHAAQFWIGRPGEHRWTRVDPLAEPSAIYLLLTGQES